LREGGRRGRRLGASGAAGGGGWGRGRGARGSGDPRALRAGAGPGPAGGLPPPGPPVGGRVMGSGRRIGRPVLPVGGWGWGGES